MWQWVWIVMVRAFLANLGLAATLLAINLGGALTAVAESTFFPDFSNPSAIRSSALKTVVKSKVWPVLLRKGGGFYTADMMYQVRGAIYASDADEFYREVGLASWYGPGFHGKRTANGEIYDMHALTAAHKTLPLPSIARITNPHNNRTILVRINDRGPFSGDRILDLSHAAAMALGTVAPGVGRVQVEYVGVAPLNGDDSQERAFLAAQSAAQPATISAPPAPQPIRAEQRTAMMQVSIGTLTAPLTPPVTRTGPRKPPRAARPHLRRSQAHAHLARPWSMPDSTRP